VGRLTVAGGRVVTKFPVGKVGERRSRIDVDGRGAVERRYFSEEDRSAVARAKREWKVEVRRSKISAGGR
jgi:hypothetical protein